jgi:hypothetical protein
MPNNLMIVALKTESVALETESVAFERPKVWHLRPKVWHLKPKVWHYDLKKIVVPTLQGVSKTVKTKYLNKRYKNNTKQRA